MHGFSGNARADFAASTRLPANPGSCASCTGPTKRKPLRGSVFMRRCPLETYWNAFQEWRKRQRLRATLCDLSNRELMDIGTTRGEIDYVGPNRSIEPEGSDPPNRSDIPPTVDGRI